MSSYQEVFIVFWKEVEKSVQENRFAKLTMAKTIGKPDLKNIFIRPISFDKDAKVLVKFRYRSRETEDTENEYTLDEAFTILKPHLKNSFLSVLLFTTTKDVTFKINKKGAGSIIENYPTFNNVTLADNNED
ncbi:hypothetical protein LPB03_14695 [Polaribacter vadi]|uniref:Uncharacterized protein n=1 Tax=Polaribacter vadi TaxID=1774273 RepID=A0A1B8TQS9_9FLAO|nr:hypothetical protein [Polaribacter vadi]AOW18627.1 hypothetical protein LPB03_14695 [Polaribacter vadi]OBY62010.1 hypothetical protein LPB3_14610 [Polaribacter vadi]